MSNLLRVCLTPSRGYFTLLKILLLFVDMMRRPFYWLFLLLLLKKADLVNIFHNNNLLKLIGDVLVYFE